MGFLGSFANPLTAIYGVVNSSAGYTSLFMPLNPISVTFLSIITRIDNFSFLRLWGWLKILGISMSSIGAFIMVSNNIFEAKLSGEILWATIYILLNVASTSLYTLIGKIMFNRSKKKKEVKEEEKVIQHDIEIKEPIVDSSFSKLEEVDLNDSIEESVEVENEIISSQEYIEMKSKEEELPIPNDTDYSPLDVNLWANMYGSLYFIILFTYCVLEDRSIFRRLDPRGFIPISYSIFMASGFGLTMNLVANKAMGPTFTSGFQCLMTPITVFLGFLIFQEKLHWFDYLGGGIVLLGLITMTIGSFLETKDVK
jgi:drug/metabolite transporter (DMT)-like permease